MVAIEIKWRDKKFNHRLRRLSSQQLKYDMLSSGYSLIFILILDDTLTKKPQENMDLILNDLFVWKPSLVPKRFIFNNCLVKGRTAHFPFVLPFMKRNYDPGEQGRDCSSCPPTKDCFTLT